MSTNAFDIIVTVILIWSAYKGFSKGLISSAASLIALLIGVWGAIKFSSITASYLTNVINVDEQVLSIIAFAVTFALIVVGIHFMAKAIEGLVKAVALGFVNNMFGAALRVLIVSFIISVVLVVVNAANRNFNFLSAKFKQESILYKPLSKLAPLVFNYLEFEDVHKFDNGDELKEWAMNKLTNTYGDDIKEEIANRYIDDLVEEHNKNNDFNIAGDSLKVGFEKYLLRMRK